MVRVVVKVVLSLVQEYEMGWCSSFGEVGMFLVFIVVEFVWFGVKVVVFQFLGVDFKGLQEFVFLVFFVFEVFRGWECWVLEVVEECIMLSVFCFKFVFLKFFLEFQIFFLVQVKCSVFSSVVILVLLFFFLGLGIKFEVGLIFWCFVEVLFLVGLIKKGVFSFVFLGLQLRWVLVLCCIVFCIYMYIYK